MQPLLGGTNRNYLPTNAAQLTAASQGAGAYPGLASGVQTYMNSNAVISPSQLAALSPPAQQQVIADRQAVALRQAVAAQALSNSSARFAALQSLIAAIPSARDQRESSTCKRVSMPSSACCRTSRPSCKCSLKPPGACCGQRGTRTRAGYRRPRSVCDPLFSRRRDRHGVLRNVLELAEQSAGDLYRQQHRAPRRSARAHGRNSCRVVRDGAGNTCSSPARSKSRSSQASNAS